MKILKAKYNSDSENEVFYIAKNNIYVAVTDYGLKLWLQEIRIKFGNDGWYWVPLKQGNKIYIGNGEEQYSTFEEAINRKVNDLYCTVYEFDSFDEMIKNWNKIEYQDCIQAKYKEQKNTE